MEDKLDNEYFKKQLEEAKRQGRKEGMADLFAALLAAAPRDQLEYLSDYEQECDDPHYLQNCLEAAILKATEQNQVELLAFFLQAGANVNSLSGYYETALYIATKKGHIEIVRALLKAGANPDSGNWDGGTPFGCAVAMGNIEIVKVLLEAGADMHKGKAAEEGYWFIDYDVAGDQVEMTQLLLEAGACIKGHKHTGWLLKSAAFNGKTKACALILEAGSDVNCKDYFGKSVLMMAVKGRRAGKLDTIRLLLKSGAEINAKDNDGRTALIRAAEAGYSGAVRLLLSAGADVFSRDKGRYDSWLMSDRKAGNAFDVATNAAVKELIKREMHRRIAAALSVLPTLPVGVRQKIIQVYVKD